MKNSTKEHHNIKTRAARLTVWARKRRW